MGLALNIIVSSELAIESCAQEIIGEMLPQSESTGRAKYNARFMSESDFRADFLEQYSEEIAEHTGVESAWKLPQESREYAQLAIIIHRVQQLLSA